MPTLNAAASTFTPGSTTPPGAAPSTPAPIEAKKANSGRVADMNGTANVVDGSPSPADAVASPPVAIPATSPPSSALPSHHQKYASEFWFPECRDCACCKGYKHGCPCPGGTCKCSGAPLDGSPNAQVGAPGGHPHPHLVQQQQHHHHHPPQPHHMHHHQQQHHHHHQIHPHHQHNRPHQNGGIPGGRGGPHLHNNNWYPHHRAPHHPGGRGRGRGGPGGPPGGRGGRGRQQGVHNNMNNNNGKPQICRFFQSPGGCRFGDQCRFSHET